MENNEELEKLRKENEELKESIKIRQENDQKLGELIDIYFEKQKKEFLELLQ